MNDVLSDEVTSINAIYEPDTLSAIGKDNEFILKIPGSPVSLRLAFPKDYPNTIPVVLGPQSIGGETRKGEAHALVELAKGILPEVWLYGEPCVYGLIDELTRYIEEDKLAAAEAVSEHEHEQDDGDEEGSTLNPNLNTSTPSLVPPVWTLSTPVTEKKSIFLARAAPVSTPTLAAAHLQHLLATDRRAAKATHNITAWRIRGGGETVYQDCDDDGETAAGGRLLHLMQIMDVWDVMVVVSRWYGGVQLGPDRFRIINQVARDALVLGGWGREDPGGGKRGHK